MEKLSKENEQPIIKFKSTVIFSIKKKKKKKKKKKCIKKIT